MAEPLPLHVERALRAGEHHLYRLDLEAGDWLLIEVQQIGVDVALHVQVEGQPPLEVDSPFSETGSERIEWVVEAASSVAVSIHPFKGTGRYRLTHRAQSGTQADRARFEAYSAFHEAEQAWRKEELDFAAKSYAEAETLARDSLASPLELLSLYRQAQVLYRQGKVEEHLQLLDRAVERARHLGTPFEEAHLAFRRAWLHNLIGNKAQAAELYPQASLVFNAVGLGELAVRSRSLGAKHCEEMGELHQARKAYLAAVELARQFEDPALEARELNNLAEVHLRLGQPRLALDRLKEALPLRRRAGSWAGEAITETSIGRAHWLLDELEEAGAAYRRSYQLHRACPHRALNPKTCDRRKLANALSGLGFTELALARRKPAASAASGHLQRAERAFRSAEEVLQPFDAPRSKAMVQINLAEVMLDRGQVDAARGRVDKALELAEAAGDRQGLASVYFAMARVEWATGPNSPGKLKAARRWSQRALEKVAEVRAESKASTLRMDYFASKARYADVLVDLTMDLHRLEPEAAPGQRWDHRAWELAEGFRAQELEEALAHSGTLSSPEEEELALALVDQERRRLQLVDVPRSTEATAVALEAVAAEQRRLALQLSEVRGSRRDQVPARPLPDPDLDRLQRKVLDAETLLLYYALGEERSHLWLIGQHLVRHRDLPPRRRLESLASQALEALGAPLSDAEAQARAEANLEVLSDLLLAPVAQELGERRLVVVAGGTLDALPFAVLPDPRNQKPLVVGHEMVHLPSVTALEMIRSRPSADPERTLLVVADPIFSLDDERLRPQGGLEAVDQERSRRGAESAPLDRLPATSAEARFLGDLLPEGQRTVWVGPDARVEHILSSDVADHQVWHVATHGRPHPEHADLLGLELSRFDASRQPLEGTLWAHALQDGILSVDLVVLAACKTGRGPTIRGEGVLSLARSFTRAGASRVLVSAWDVDDAATERWTRSFYQALLIDGLSPPAALRAAQLDMLDDTHTASSSLWGAFMLRGDWR